VFGNVCGLLHVAKCSPCVSGLKHKPAQKVERIVCTRYSTKAGERHGARKLIRCSLKSLASLPRTSARNNQTRAQKAAASWEFHLRTCNFLEPPPFPANQDDSESGEHSGQAGPLRCGILAFNKQPLSVKVATRWARAVRFAKRFANFAKMLAFGPPLGCWGPWAGQAVAAKGAPHKLSLSDCAGFRHVAKAIGGRRWSGS